MPQMGFTTGVLGGATLTYTILYLTLVYHRSNRSVQHSLLSQQSVLLNNLISPPPPAPAAPAYITQSGGLTETLKDAWNRQIEETVRAVQNADWSKMRERWEARASNIWHKPRNAETVEKANEAVASKVEVKGNMRENMKKSEGEIQQERPKRLLEMEVR